MTNHKPNRIAHWIGNVLCLAGLTAFGIWAFSWLSLNIWQAWQNRQFDLQRAAPQTAARTHIENGGIVGRIAIPRLNVRAIVREGDSDPTLNVALGHIPGTALPGQEGNVGVAGHRDGLFRGLKNVAANDEITFETPGASYLYRVEGTQIVKPADIQVLNPGSTRELTLVTCFPFEYVGSAPDRFIVKARLISEDAARNDIHEEAPAPAPVRTEHHAQIAFNVPQGHSRELVSGEIWFGLSSADAAGRTVDGWVWVMPERQTIWLRNMNTRQPVFFYQKGEKRELVITGVARSYVSGYLVLRPQGRVG